MSQDPTVLDRLFDAWEAGDEAPADLIGQVDMDTAYTMQLEILARRIASGRRQSGWKLGQTNAAMRAERGESEPAPGFLLADQARASASTLAMEGATNWCLEPELALILAAPVAGADVDAADVQAAVGATVAAFELVRKTSGWADRALSRAVNGSTSGYVLGVSVPGCPDPAALDTLRVEVTRNGEAVAAVRAGDVNDNPLASTAWLARRLDRHGAGLAAGAVILTGSFAGLLPIAPGEHWRARVGALPWVELHTT